MARVKEMDSHCGECKLIDWCGDPYERPYLCCDSRFKNMEVEEYINVAETSTKSSKEEIANDVYNRSKRSV